MANSLSNMAPDILVRHDKVLRELCGFIPSVTINAGAERAAYNDTVRSFFTRPVTVNTSYSPSMTIPEGTDQTVDTDTLTLDNYASVMIPWTGEDVKHVDNGFGFEAVRDDQISQAFRAIYNKIELGIATAAKIGASRAVGTAGTTPFGSNLDGLIDLRKILADNGGPMDDGQWSFVMDTTAGAKMRKLSQLQKVNEAGESNMLRQGTLSELSGFMIKESGQIGVHTAGAGTGYDFVSAGEAVGQTTLTLEGGTVNTTGFKAGDTITHAGDSVNRYVVKTGLTSTGGDIVINKPGLLVAGVDANEITIGGSYTPNIGFHRSAIELAIRPPAQPPGGDSADDTMLVTDPLTGLTIELALYRGYQKVMIEPRCFWTAKVWKSELVATLMG